MTRQVIGQGLAAGLGRFVRLRRPRLDFGLNRWGLSGLGDLLVLQPHLELIETLRAGTELVAAQSGQLVLELLDEKFAIIELALEHTDRALEGVDVIGKLAWRGDHGLNIYLSRSVM